VSGATASDGQKPDTENKGLTLMAKFTAPDGSQVVVDEARVIRIRQTVAGEEGKTRIDWTMLSLVKEPLDEVVPIISAKLGSLTALTGLADKKVWFDAKPAVGPLPITDGQRSSGFNSSFKIMNYLQYVVETPDQVRAVIKAAGGAPVPDA
jgi:hypothetical protein